VFVDTGAHEHDEIDDLLHGHGRTEIAAGDVQKAAQSRFFDHVALEEFEIERPTGAPAWYRFLIGEKLRRSLAPFHGRLDGWTALTVCGGSGMDAEFLARAGATVISSDLSLGAARRVKERGLRHAVAITPVVADVEHLPFADQSIDLVLVHDGLHHLGDPFIGLAEMARVARRAVCVTEPAQAGATTVAVRLGLALEREEAGNRVARLRPGDLRRTLEAAGFSVVKAGRYAMYYKHVPGRVSRWLSRPLVLPVAKLGWRVASGILGAFGNKLVVVGVRPDTTARP
jgi:ubiquinone/menaquinone biosynthesis C-methylase UbiE